MNKKIEHTVRELLAGSSLFYFPGDRRDSIPSEKCLIQIVGLIKEIIFPNCYAAPSCHSPSLSEAHMMASVSRLYSMLLSQVERALYFLQEVPPEKQIKVLSKQHTEAFISQLPALREKMGCDIEATYEGDPSLAYKEESIFFSLGIQAIFYYRIAHVLFQLGVPIVPLIISKLAHSETGIDIHPQAQIGSYLMIDHGTGVVIGATSIIGDHVRIYQGVTLGAKSFPADKDGNPIKGILRHPIIEDRVIIYAHASILGRITVGKNSVIGSNIWLTESVPPNSKVFERM